MLIPRLWFVDCMTDHSNARNQSVKKIYFQSDLLNYIRKPKTVHSLKNKQANQFSYFPSLPFKPLTELCCFVLAGNLSLFARAFS